MSERKPLVLVIGSGHRAFREYLLRSAARAADLWLFEDLEPDWQTPHVVGHTRVDTFDVEATRRAALALDPPSPVTGVFSYHEGMTPAAAAVAESLGLPGPGPEAVAACRDKRLTRALLAKHDVAQPRFGHSSTRDELRAVVKHVELPAVVKPAALGASEGVVRVDRPKNLDAALAVAQGARQAGMPHDPEVLVEEYVDGPEVSVDGWCDGIAFHPLVLARKRLGPPPYFEEVGHLVDAADPLLDDPATLDLLTEAHLALGHRGGITHSEIRYGPGGPRLIEVNGRLGGDLIPHLGARASGIDPGGTAVDLALGRRPAERPREGRIAEIRFLYPPYDCAVEALGEPADSDQVSFHPLVAPGAVLRLPPRGYAATARHTAVVAVADSAAECSALLDEAAGRVRFVGVPLA